MAESSSSSSWALGSFSPIPTTLTLTLTSRWKTKRNTNLLSIVNAKAPPYFRPQFRLRCDAAPKDSTGGFGDDDHSFGFYPWDSDSAIEWVPQDRVTLFTSDGIVQIGGSVLPHKIRISSSSSHKQGGRSLRFQRQERDYMDPNQGLCLGALFDIAATNGLDTGRRLCMFGFCRSIEMLSDVVEDTVLEHGGEIVAAEKASKGGLQEKLSMTVAVPLLWGVPPASETLHLAVQSGGGIVEKIYWQWDFL